MQVSQSEDEERELRSDDLESQLSSEEKASGGAEVEEVREYPNEDMDEDMFGMTKCSLVRDFYFIEKHNRGYHRYVRLGSTLSLLLLCLSIQVFLLRKVKQFVSAKLVHDIRISYDVFEEHMYTEHYLSKNGNHRGVAGTFQEDRFMTLDEQAQTNACRIPLSQPDFFFFVLFLWTLTCTRELQKCFHDLQTFICNTERCTTMLDAFDREKMEDGGDFVITRLTMKVKALLALLIIIPRGAITCYLLWLGCRWLLATNEFQELLINAVALEFVLTLKETMYMTLVPKRSQIDLDSTKKLPPIKTAGSHWTSFTSSIIWGVLAALWVTLYMGVPHVFNGLQQVLPDYKWDVHEVCKPWIAWRYCVDPPCPSAPGA